MRWIFTNWLSELSSGFCQIFFIFYFYHRHLIAAPFLFKLKSEFLLFSLQLPLFYGLFFCVFSCQMTFFLFVVCEFCFLRALGLNCACARTFNSFRSRNKENEIKQNKIVWQIVAGAEIRFQARR